jgi:hypothetical protein
LVVATAGCALLASGSWIAASDCIPTANVCNPTNPITSSQIQIGGNRSLGNEGVTGEHGVLSDGTVAEALYQFTFDREISQLTLVVTNTSPTVAHLTGIFFNVPPAVTGVSLVSTTGTLPWKVAFDRNRADGSVDTNPSLPDLHGDGFGLFHVFITNDRVDTAVDGGRADDEIRAGHNVTFVFHLNGNFALETACSFTAAASIVPPGDKIVDGIARFQGGDSGGDGHVSACEKGDLLVTGLTLSVAPGDRQVTAMWRTATEVDNAGFRVLRTDVRTNKTVPLNTNLIPAQGSNVSGFDYAYVDSTAVNGKRYVYKIEDWDINSVNTIHGGSEAIPNPPTPPVRLLEPAYEAKAGNQVRLKWESNGRLTSLVEISADPDFPARATMQLRVGTRTARSLTGREIDQVRAMGAAGEGGVYWRVKGTDARSNVSMSQTFFLSVTN